MTQEEKDLLLKDLCARLPYGVKLHCYSNAMVCIGPYTLDTIVLDRIFNEDTEYVLFDEIKPYLLPMSSMTEEQKDEFIDTCTFLRDDTFGWTDRTFDWLNKNHFDYRGLIPMGLANNATGLNLY